MMEPPQSQTKTKRRPLWVRCLRWFFFSVLGCIFSIALIWAGLQTPWAKNRLTAWIASATAGTDGYQVTLEGLDGRLPFSILIDRVTLSDAKGKWLEGRRLDISLKVAPLLTGMLDVGQFRMDALSISRLPHTPTQPSEKASAPKESPPLSLPHVMVREIQIDRIDLGKEVAGAPMTYSLRSSAQTGDQQVKIIASLKDLNHADDALRLSTTYNLGTRHMATELTYHESKGGLVAGLMNLSEAQGITLDLKAHGPLSDVTGHLKLAMKGYGGADIDYQLGLDGPTTVAMDGQLHADHGIVPKDVAAAIGGLDADICCRATVSPDKMIQIKAFTAKAPSSAISVEGTADLSKGLIDMQVKGSPLDVSPFLRGSGLAYQSMGPVLLSAKGPFSQPEVMVTTTLERVSIRDATLKQIALKANAAFEPDYSGIKQGRAWVTIQDLQDPQLPPLKGPLQVDVAAGSPDFRRWHIEDLHVTAPEVALQAQGARIDTQSGDFSLDLSARLDRLAGLIPPEAGNLNGGLVMTGRAEGSTATQQVQADLNITLTRLSGLPPLAAGAIGPELTLTTRTTLKDSILRLAQAQLTGGPLDLRFDGSLDMKKETVDATYHLLLNDLSRMSEAVKTRLSGSLSSQGSVTGHWGDFRADVALSSEGLQVNDLDLKTVQARLETAGLPEKPSGSLHAKASALDQPLRLDTGFSWSGEVLTLSGAEAALPGIDMNADLTIAPLKSQVSGMLEGKVSSLRLLKALSGLKAEGSGAFQVKAGGTDHPDALTLDADFKALRLNDHRVSKLTLKGHLDDMKTLRGQVRLEAVDGMIKETRLKRLSLDAKGALDKAVVNLQAKGSTSDTQEGNGANVPIFVSAGLQIQHDEAWQLRLDLFKALYGELDVVLAHPATLTLGDREMILDDLEIHTAKGNLQAQARLSTETAEASARITDLPLDLFEPFIGRDLSGTVSAGCNISGTLADPAVDVRVRIHDHLIPRGPGVSPLRLDAGLDAKRQGERFNVNLALSGLSKVPFSAEGSVPVYLSLRPFALDLDKSGELKGKLKGNLDLTVLKGISGMEDQTLEGLVEVDMGVAGSLDKWALTGGITISRARYENMALGLILADINGRLDAHGRTLRLSRLTATDGNSGTIALEGGITTATPFPMDADLTFKQAALLRKEVLTSTASGKLDLKGDMKRLDLTGNIILDPTELTIPKRLPPDVVVIPVTEINLPPGLSIEQTAPSGVPKFLFMDLGIQIPARFFVRGRGLDVEFRGQLTVQGPAHNPVVRGTLNVVRGTFQFLTRTFHVNSGQIAFDGATPPVPYLNITTEVYAGQIDAQVRVTGPADAFKLTLTSQPPLPQDEIMAQILFGQSVAKLNAFQAYQLAASVSQLSGGGIPDIAGETRKLLGIDRLSIEGGSDDRNDRDNGPTLSAGKYVSDRVYVGVEQDLTDAKQDVVVEVDITPNFSVESKAGTKSGAGLGFNWKYDY